MGAGAVVGLVGKDQSVRLVSRDGREARRRAATPLTPVRFRLLVLQRRREGETPSEAEALGRVLPQIAGGALYKVSAHAPLAEFSRRARFRLWCLRVWGCKSLAGYVVRHRTASGPWKVKPLWRFTNAQLGKMAKPQASKASVCEFDSRAEYGAQGLPQLSAVRLVWARPRVVGINGNYSGLLIRGIWVRIPGGPPRHRPTV
jgi:hypothetical protein